jgi:hypothetical protein
MNSPIALRFLHREAAAIPRLSAVKVSTSGVLIGTYEPAGEIVTGSFALD